MIGGRSTEMHRMSALALALALCTTSCTAGHTSAEPAAASSPSAPSTSVSGQTGGTLSSAGIFGIKLGSELDNIRAAHPDFPATNGSASVTWRDCDFTFAYGKLVTISPRDGGRTPEGIGPGSPVAKAAALYGDPLAWAPDPDSTTTAVIFDAGPDGEGAYRMEVDGFDSSGATPTGTIKAIVLCPCKQR